MISKAHQYAQQHRDKFLLQLTELLSIPSVSTQESHREDMQRCAEWLKMHLLQIGLQHAEIISNGGQPIVFAKHQVNPEAPTFLLYGHYDVQPADPLHLWTTPPFKPSVRNGNLYARGATDNKGQLFIHLKALEAMLQTHSLPVNIKIVLEGEEESGVGSLSKLLVNHPQKFKADIALISDTTMVNESTPTLSYGVRGNMYAEITLTGPMRDLHSGEYGGIVHNPLTILCRLLGNILNKDGQITLPGFYENVNLLTTEEKERLRGIPFDHEEVKHSTGVSHLTAEKGFTAVESSMARPSFDLHGFWGGYQEKGIKTIIPTSASAKFSTRLVPNQTPEEIADIFKQYFEKHTPQGLKVQLEVLGTSHPMVINIETPPIRKAAQALEMAFEIKPQFIREGGSIPVVSDFKKILGIDTLLVGFGLYSDMAHSPDEHLSLDRFYKGISTIIQLLSNYSKEAFN